MSGGSAVDYGALDISDVTSDVFNTVILRRLKNDDKAAIPVTDISIRDNSQRDARFRGGNEYAIDNEDAHSMGVLGYYLGRCTSVKTMFLRLPREMNGREMTSDILGRITERFLAELRSNRSIEHLSLLESRVPRDFFRMLAPFINDNHKLESFSIRACGMDAEQFRSLSLALRENKSLKRFCLVGSMVREIQFYDEQSIIDIIETLKVHPRLVSLDFEDFSLGGNACAALSDLLRQSSRLQTLHLVFNNIDDSGVEALVGGFAHCRELKYFHLCQVGITVRGWRAVAALLEDPNCSLQELDLRSNDISDESATIIANALARNRSLVELNLMHNGGITLSRGWAAFLKVICDTSSVNNTFLSNHVLRLFMGDRGALPDAYATFSSLVNLNKQDDKKRIAVSKILQYHEDFDMQPLFEWDLKVLPFVVEWFEKAAAYEIETEGVNRKRKLAAIFQFVRGMPELAIDGITGASKKSMNVGGKRPYSAVCEST